jgi:hypothetical protein
MLTERRSIQVQGNEISRTPLIVPSFSSKGFPDVAKIIEFSREFLVGPLLVSAYDLYYKRIQPPLDFPTIIFLDSGGYEASKDSDLSDLGERDHKPAEWSQEMHEEVLSKWQSEVTTVFISYDSPKERIPLKAQIARAKKMAPSRDGILREILIKPETPAQTLIKIESILKEIHSLEPFDIIGVTEKEIGNSILNRMENIARLRLGLEKAGLKTPLHVFGSLDTISTPLYFLAGADIFDGLTWLRFAYREGLTIYKQNYGALKLGMHEKTYLVDGRCWCDNYAYLSEMELEMRRFLKAHDFRSFRYHKEEFKKAFDTIAEALQEQHHGR